MGKRIKIVLAVIFMIPLVLILFIMISSSNETKINFYCNEDYIELDSFIHDKIYFQDIQDIKLLCNNDMHIQKQGIGFLNNDFFSGEAVAEDIGNCRAYYYLSNDSYILIDSNVDVLLNFKSKEETRKIYENLKTYLLKSR